MSQRGEGVRKVPKKCHALFEWPLIRCRTIFCLYREIVLGPIMSMVRLRFRVTSPNFANFAWPNIFLGEELGGLTFCKLTLSRANFFIHQELWPNNIVWWPNNFDWWPNNFGWWPYNFTQCHKNYFCYHKLINQCEVSPKNKNILFFF